MGTLTVIEGRRARDVDAKEAVALLEDWLTMAKAGRFVCVGLVGVQRDYTCMTAASEAKDGFTSLIGGVAILQYRLTEGRELVDPKDDDQ